ncbi:MAG TPA: DNA translocase FtsK 4TM domain-containing protein [Acidimicrobiales bacterium]|nr:DNA translocase FtsK 4TM domain-containing protein [Acidimicrobiales bacterium]
MTTRQGSSRSSSRGRSGGSSRSSTRGRSTTRAARRSGGGRADASKKTTRRDTVVRGPSLTSRAVRSSSRVLGRHADDVTGLLLVAAGLVCGLGVYAGGGGPVGRGAADVAATLLGHLHYALPPVLVVAGGALVLRRTPTAPDTADAEAPSTGAHVGVGATLLALAAAGILHLIGGSPDVTGPDRELREAGGWLGAAVGTPLQNLLGTGGSAAFLSLVGVIGLVVLTRTRLRDAADRTVAGVAPLTATLNQRLATLFRLPYDDDTVVADAIDPALVPDDDTLVEPPDDDPGDGPGESDPTVAEKPRRRRLPKFVAPEPVDGEGEVEVEQLEIALGPAGKASPWKLPPLTLLERSGSQQVDRKAIEDTGRTLEKALADHGVETRLVGMVVGPTVSRYELELGPGVKVNRVTSLHKDIAYAMATPDVRILAPIPGKQAIGVEVPNARRQIVALGDILVSEDARRATHPLEVAIGRDINGRSIMMNLASMPHVLIAGATGAGKSSCLNSLLTSVLMRSTPDQVRMILVDPKRVEMGQYDRLPHLLTQVVTNPKKAANALAWAVKEMERRYDLLAEVGFRDITGYNAAVDKGDLDGDGRAVVHGYVDDDSDGESDAAESGRQYPRLPFILVVIDELADLMMVAARDVEESIARLAQMARAVGIHLVIATQRPSVNVITGLIKANVPARIAFAVSSVTDSRVILDQGGAERLVGKGDMLVLDGGSSVARRIQGAWVTEDEVRRVASVWKRQAPEVRFDDSVQGSDDGPAGSSGSGGGAGGDDDDDLLWQAMELVVRSQLGSTSMLQRKLRVGFARAGRLMDLLEQRGVVGPSEGSKARAVLMTVDELEELTGGGD